MPTININPRELERLSGLKIPKNERERMAFFGCVKGEIEEYTKDNLKLEIADSNRLDIWTIDGIARALKSHHTGKSEKVEFGQLKDTTIVNSKMRKVRPYISVAVVKGVKLTDETIKQLMQQQQKIDDNYGRARKRTSIGLYDYDLLFFPLKYTMTKPDKNAFIPLDMGEKMPPRDVINLHPTAKKYSHLVEGLNEYPILLDDEWKVLSMPPLINSNDLGKITPKTRNVLVEVTGNDKEAVDNVAKVMALSLAAYGGKLYKTKIKYGEKVIESPSTEEADMTISSERVRNLIGIDMSNSEIVSLLKKAGYIGVKASENKILVKIPYYRTDIMHEVDVIEDIMIQYGYNNFETEYPYIASWGGITERNRFSNVVRELCIGMGLQETANFVMTSSNILKNHMGISNYVEIENPMSETFNCLRPDVLPSLLQFLSANTHNPYPQKIFEVGDAIVKDSKEGTRTVRKLAVLSAHEKANFSESRQYLENLSAGLGITLKVKPSEDSSFISGRFAVIYKGNTQVGVIGELHPRAITNFGLTVPAVALEINLDKLI